MKRITEDIEFDYKNHYSDIDRGTFDAIVAMDPQAKNNQLGSSAKSLLLRCYQNGERDFVEKPAEVRAAIQRFFTTVRSNPNIPGVLKNLNNYPSVEAFIKYVSDPEGNPIDLDSLNSNKAKENDKPKESKLDSIYKQYYEKNIDRETFDLLVNCDADTNENSLGATAKNLILPLFIKSNDADKKYIKDNIEQLKDAIIAFNKNKEYLNPTHRDIKSFTSIADFIKISTQGEQSDLVSYLKGLGDDIWKECGYIGSTLQYDVFQPITHRAASYIAGADDSPSMPGYSAGFHGPGICEDGAARDYSSTAYGHWCTVGGSWNSYRYYNNLNDGLFFDFMKKGEDLYRNNRKANVQIAVVSNGFVGQNATGEEKFGSGTEYFDTIIAKDPALLALCANYTYKGKPAYIALIPQVVQYKIAKEFGDKPFIYKGPESLTTIEKSFGKTLMPNIKKSIKEIIIEEGVGVIDVAEFENFTALRKVTFPSSLKKIKAEAFKNCLSLQLITLPDSLEFIGGQAFAFCDALHGTIKIPQTLTYIGEKAFYGTDVKLSIPSETPDKNIVIAPNDIPWYAKRTKVINAKESLKCNNEEEINEDVLDEKLPRDLANAYAMTANYADVRGVSHQGHSQLPQNRERLGSLYDYENASYEEISAEEAINRIKSNPIDASKLRALFKTDPGSSSRYSYLELELRNNGKIYPIQLPVDATISKDDGDYYSKDEIRHKTQSFKGLSDILRQASKIYWTDEYEHAFSDDYKAARTHRAADTIEGPSKSRMPKYLDTGTHYHRNLTHQLDQINTGTLNNDSVNMNNNIIKERELGQTILTYIRAIKELKQQEYKKKISKLDNIIKSWEDNKDSYDEDEWEEQLNSYKALRTHMYDAYQSARKNYKESRIIIEQIFNKNYVEWFNKTKAELLKIEQTYKEKENTLRNAQNRLAEYRNLDIKDDSRYQKIAADTAEAQDQLDGLIATKNALVQKLEDYRRQLIELQEKISLTEVTVADSEKIIDKKAQEVEESKNSIDKQVEELSSIRSAEMKQLEDTILEIKTWYNENPNDAYGKKFSLPKDIELDDKVASKVNVEYTTISRDPSVSLKVSNLKNKIANL